MISPSALNEWWCTNSARVLNFDSGVTNKRPPEGVSLMLKGQVYNLEFYSLH